MPKEQANQDNSAKSDKQENYNDYYKKDWHDNEWRNKYWMKRHHGRYGHAGGGAVYGMGFIGALVYFWQHANTFRNVVMGLLQAIVWPALLVWHLFGIWKL